MNDKEKFIKQNYLNMTQKEMAKQLGISKSSIEYYIRKNNLYTKKDLFPQWKIDYMINNYKNMSYKEIGDYIGLTERQVRGKLNNMGYSKLRKFNKHYFDVIDSDIKAYFLGFIFADGWVVKSVQNRTYELGISIQSQDKYLLDCLNQELGGVHIINHEEPTIRIIDGIKANIHPMDTIRVYSKNIVEALIKHNIVPNKTKFDLYPIVSDEYFFDFLRGYIDGDGCFYNYNGGVVCSITCASKAPLEWIYDKLLLYGIKTQVYKEKDRKYKLFCSNNESMKKLVNLLYHQNFSFCLKRKYVKIKSFLGFAA